MAKRAYLSNINLRWPFDRQEALFASLPNWPKGYTVFRDEIDARTKRAHRPASLANRAELLRKTTRVRNGEDIYLASLGPFAWTQDDLLAQLTLAAARGATVHVLDAGLVIAPTPAAETLHKAVLAFAEARKAHKERHGGAVSGKRRRAAAEARAQVIEARWPMPSDDYPTAKLLVEAGLSVNTARLILGSRPEVQRMHRVAMAANAKRATATAKRKEKGDE